MLERRKFVRLKDSLKITYKEIGQESIPKGSLSSDICGGGVSIPTHYRLKPGKIIELEISLPRCKNPVAALGEVVWIETRDNIDFPFLIGVKFTNIDPFDQGKILNYITHRVQKGELVEIEWID